MVTCQEVPSRARRREDKSDFDCGICMDIPDGEVNQCSSGHIFCATCLRAHRTASSVTSRDKCPTCRVPLGDRIRNLVVERLIARLETQCRFCGETSTRGEVKEHELKCSRREVSCAAHGFGCTWQGRGYKDKEKHEQDCLAARCFGVVLVMTKPQHDTIESIQDRLRELPVGVHSLLPGYTPRCLPDGAWRVRSEDDVFPTVTYAPDIRISHGRWYYEVNLIAGVPSAPQFGWATTGFTPTRTVGPIAGHGCGDDLFSWSVDGDRQMLWHGGQLNDVSVPRWHHGDVIGCLLDLDMGVVLFFRNGALIECDDDNPWPFDTLRNFPGRDYFPALSMQEGLVRCNFEGPFLHDSTLPGRTAANSPVLPVSYHSLYRDLR